MNYRVKKKRIKTGASVCEILEQVQNGKVSEATDQGIKSLVGVYREDKKNDR